MRCDTCDINYPLAWGDCPACGKPLRSDNVEVVDKDYREKVAPARKRVEEERELQSLFPAVIASTFLDGAEEFLKAVDVVRSGISHQLQPDEIIRIRNKETGQERYYEIGHYDYDGRRYWVLPMEIELPTVFPEEWVDDAN